MFKIFGRLIGLGNKELKYNKEILIFMIIASVIFIFLAFSHTKSGANILYNNFVNKKLLMKNEKKGILLKDKEDYIYKFKEMIPINIREYAYDEIEDRLENFINYIKKDKNMNEIVYELESIEKSNNKKILLDKLKKLNLDDMLNKISKEYIVNLKLDEVVKWQTNVFIADIYFIIGIFIGFMFIIVKVFSGITLFNDNKKEVKIKYKKNIKK